MINKYYKFLFLKILREMYYGGQTHSVFFLSLSLVMESLACHIPSPRALQHNALQGDELSLEHEVVPSAMREMLPW